MTIKIHPNTTPDTIRTARAVGVVAGKVYPRGVTTHSDDGVENFSALAPVFETMQTVGMVLCLHGEEPGTFCLDREEAFLPRVKKLAADFPRLKIVLEHITTRAAIDCVKALPKNVAATITAHHLVLTLDDVIGGEIKPHHFCKPIAKWREDRDALLDVVRSGNPKFFFGSDSAPHTRERKECASGCAGVYTAPILMPLLAEIFDVCGALPTLEAFTSQFGAEFYALPLNTGTVTLERKEWTVPEQYDGLIPFMAGQKLAWQLAV